STHIFYTHFQYEVTFFDLKIQRGRTDQETKKLIKKYILCPSVI
ncbi:MAG: hypothetical protein ACJAUP_002517, partial [Cellvibrionaceae bacterium]